VSRLAFDTSAAVPFVIRSHVAHATTRRAAAGHEAVLTTHSLAETYSVLTRLPGDARVAPDDAVALIEANFSDILPVPVEEARSLPRLLAARGIAGGAVYDGLVALAARAAGIALFTRDARALDTYRVLAVPVQVAPD
jgi:predicted nucleic acid-binding protein